MNNRRSLLMLCAAVFAAALVALPGVAHAEDITLTQKDFLVREGVYTKVTLASGNTYTLDEDVTGYIEVSFGSNFTEPAYLDLNGKTLTCPSGDSDPVNLISTSNSGKLVVSNGNLVQPKSGKSVVRADGGTVTLDLGNDNKATSASFMCIDAERGTVNIQSGRYVNSNSSEGNEELLRAGENGSIVVTGGVFERNGNSPIAKTQGSSNSSIVLSGGSYNAYPEGITALGTGKSLHWRNKYYVDDTAIVKRAYNYYVETGSTIFGDVCFETFSDAMKFASERGLTDASVHSLTYTVTFNSNGGNPSTIKDASVHYGYQVTEPSVSKEGYKLLGWTYDASGEYFEFDNVVTGDLELTAQWLDVVAKVGDVEYDSLQKAIDAANDGDTITLCKSVEESVTFGTGSANKKLTLDLGGNTLTGTTTNGAITVNTKCELTIKNGTVIAPKDDCLLLDRESKDSTITLGDSDHELTFNCVAGSDDNAVCVRRAATVNIIGGVYTSKGPALNIYSNAGSSPISICGGSFSSTDGDASVMLNGGAVTISGGDFSGNVKKNNGASLTVTGGNIGGHVEKVDDDTKLTITGGTFGDKTNEGDIDSVNYHMVIDGQRYKVGEHEWEIGFDGKNAKTHSKHCTVNGCGIHKDYERCSGGVATCQQGAVCTICDGEYTDKDASNHVGIDTDKGYQSNANGHWHLCSGCGERYESEISAHTSATRTVTEPTYEAKGKGEEYCSVCGYVIREYDIDKLDPGKPAFVGLQSRLQYDGETKFKVTLGTTEVTPVVKYGDTVLECDSEGYYTLPVADGEVTLTATAGDNATSITVYSYADHDWSTAQAIGNGKHKKVCKRTGCGESVEGDCAAEEGAKATCTHGLICAECGDEYDKTRDLNNHTALSENWDKTDDVHYHLCSDCGAHVDEAEHAYAWFVDKRPEEGEDGHAYEYCTVCRYQNGKEKVIPWRQDVRPSVSGIADGGSYCAAGEDVTFTVSEEGNPEAIFTVVANGVRLAGTGNTFVLPAANGMVKLSVADGNGHNVELTVYCYDSHDWADNWTSAGDGTHYQTCNRCGAKSDAESCSYDEGAKPESDKDGHWHVCGVCGGKVDEEGHDFGSWQKTAEGCKRVCKDCGYEQTVDHEFGEWESTSAGHKHTCKTCGYVAEGAHTYGKWAEAEDGSKHERVCSDCGYKETAEHDYVWVTDKEATATEDGSAHEECRDCGHESGQTKVLPKTGGDDSGDGDDKGDDSGDGDEKPDYKPDYKPSEKPDKKPASKPDPELPATGDPATIISAIAATGAALAVTGYIRRRK